MPLPLSIWITGQPVKSAEKARGNFFEMISAGLRPGFSGPFQALDACDVQAQLPSADQVSGVVVSGSPARILDGEAWMLRVEQQLAKLNAEGVPILGICFGHQLLGRALGGVVGVNPRGREIGCKKLNFQADDPLLDAAARHVPDTSSVVMTHLDPVLEVPAGTEVLASTDLEPHAALRFGPTCWGVQFHPEMDAEIIGYYLKERKAAIENEGLNAENIIQNRRDSAFGASLLEEFGRFCEKRS